MLQQSKMQTVKAVDAKWWSVTLAQDHKGVYHITKTNKLSKEVKYCQRIDYNMANFIFEDHLNSFQGQ